MDAGLPCRKIYISFYVSVTTGYISGAILSLFTQVPLTLFFFFPSLVAEMNHGESNKGGGGVLGAFTSFLLTQFFLFRHSLQ